MNEGRGLGETITAAAAAIVGRMVEYLPSILGAVLLLVVGWLVATVLRALTSRLAALLDALLARFVAPERAERLRIARPATVLGTIVFWAVLLFFITAATKVLGLETFTNWLARALDYLPTLIAGLLIVAAGYVVSRFAGELIETATDRLEASQRTVLARAAQATILVGAILVGADQIGIKVTFLAIFVGAAATAIVGGVVVATSLGARTYVANLIGAHYLRHSYEVGQRIRVSQYEGRIVELTALSVVLETDDGRVTLPGRVFNDEAIVLVASGGDRG